MGRVASVGRDFTAGSLPERTPPGNPHPRASSDGKIGRLFREQNICIPQIQFCISSQRRLSCRTHVPGLNPANVLPLRRDALLAVAWRGRVSSPLEKPEDTLRQAQGERKTAEKLERGTAHAEPVEAWGGVFQRAVSG